MCEYMHMSTDTPGTGITGSCKLPNVSAGKEPNLVLCLATEPSLQQRRIQRRVKAQDHTILTQNITSLYLLTSQVPDTPRAPPPGCSSGLLLWATSRPPNPSPLRVPRHFAQPRSTPKQSHGRAVLHGGRFPHPNCMYHGISQQISLSLMFY